MMINQANHRTIRRMFFQGLEAGCPLFSKAWKTVAIALLATVVVRAVASEAEPLTLESALRRALLYNRDLILLAAAIESAWLDSVEAQAEFAWRLQPNMGVESADRITTRRAGLDLLRKVEWGTEILIGADATWMNMAGDPSARHTVRFSIAQPLFRYAGREINREIVIRAESRTRSALRDIEIAKSEIALRVVQTYHDLYRAKQQATMEETAHSRLERLLRLTRTHTIQGRATQVDILRIESQFAEAAARARAARELTESLRLDFADLLGLVPETLPSIIPPALPPPIVETLEDALATARARRLELAQAEQDIEDMRRGVRMARRRTRPDLRLTASIERRSGERDVIAGSDGDETHWSIGLRTGGDIGGARERAAYMRAVLDEQLAIEYRETTQRLIERQVRRAFLEVSRAQADLEPARRNLDVAEARLRLARRMFEMGRADGFTVSDAETQFQRAEGAWLNARIEAALAAYRLRQATGTLLDSPPELRPRPTATGDVTR